MKIEDIVAEESAKQQTRRKIALKELKQEGKNVDLYEVCVPLIEASEMHLGSSIVTRFKTEGEL